MDIEQALHLWNVSLEAQNETMREHASEAIEELIPDVDDFSSWIENMDKSRVVPLFGDVAVSAKRRKME